MISIPETNFTQHASFWKNLAIEIENDVNKQFMPKPDLYYKDEGVLVLVDWNRKEILCGKKLKRPQGFVIENRKIFVCCSSSEKILTLQGNEIVHQIENRFFNLLHSIEKTEKGFLVTSSGTDFIAEIDYDGNLIRSFFLFEYGYDFPSNCKRPFDKEKNYNNLYQTLNLQATHVNSARYWDSTTILATLFHQGELIKIDFSCNRIEKIMTNLQRPHSIRKRKNGYMLCDSKAGAVVLLDKTLKNLKRIATGCFWIQDAMEVDETIYALANKPKYTETNETSQAILIKDEKIDSRLDFGDCRLYEIHEVAPSDVDYWVDSWKNENFHVAANFI